MLRWTCVYVDLDLSIYTACFELLRGRDHTGLCSQGLGLCVVHVQTEVCSRVSFFFFFKRVQSKKEPHSLFPLLFPFPMLSVFPRI